MYVDPANTAAQWVAANGGDNRVAVIKSRIAEVPTARWFTKTGDAQYVRAYIDTARNAGRVPVLVTYNIPHRDCGSHSAGGAASADEYRAWIDQIAVAIGDTKTVVIMEPDSLFVVRCLSAEQLNERLGLIKNAVYLLASKAPNAVVYLDGGTSMWDDTTAQLADLLAKAGVEQVQGFAFNTSNFKIDSEARTHAAKLADAVQARTGLRPHFVIDSSRNGSKVGDALWCNPPGASLGERPAWADGSGGFDGTLWIKHPGESDGACGTDPGSKSGDFLPGQAFELAK